MKAIAILAIVLAILACPVCAEERKEKVEIVDGKKVVTVTDKDGWISKEYYDGSNNMVIWESADKKRVLLTWDVHRQLAQVDYCDGTRILLRYGKGSAGGIESDVRLNVRAKIKLSADWNDYERLDPKTGKKLDKPKRAGNAPDLDFFLKKMKAVPQKKSTTTYEYDPKGRLKKAEAK